MGNPQTTCRTVGKTILQRKIAASNEPQVSMSHQINPSESTNVVRNKRRGSTIEVPSKRQKTGVVSAGGMSGHFQIPNVTTDMDSAEINFTGAQGSLSNIWQYSRTPVRTMFDCVLDVNSSGPNECRFQPQDTARSLNMNYHNVSFGSSNYQFAHQEPKGNGVNQEMAFKQKERDNRVISTRIWG